MIQTQALVVDAPGAEFTLQDIVLDEPQADELVVDMVASGICHTDLKVASGEYVPESHAQHAHTEGLNSLPVGGFPFVAGHEGSGIVRSVGSGVTHLQPGDRVLLSHASCGECWTCREKHPTYCLNYHSLNFIARRQDGSCTAKNASGKEVSARFFGQSSFSKTSIVHFSSVVKVPNLTEDELRQLAPLGCGLMTGAATVPNMFKAKKGEGIAIFGAGGVGFGALFYAASIGCYPIIVVEVNERRLALASELGATHTLNPKTVPDVSAAIRDLTGGLGVHYSVETTANEQAQLAAVTCVRKMGKVGIIASGGDKRILKVPTEMLILGGAQILGVANGDAYTPEFIPHMVEEYRAGRFPLDRFTKFYKPEEVNQASHDMHTGEVIKPIIVWR
ncbi:aryl-alcohol dehydrogenase [Calocera viscosa TUFC12733]|uniref:Aryl-alcohol dehydrogenase n=1 Tax=Calocera viscosa (strain TUFC12733) TaxID=1330018 RepID=A0A167IZ87_CALVF|nr:aryl-alcohol dehydrogenase [Calocera viscosa TUFC12733]